MVTPALAGVARMPYGRFLAFNAVADAPADLMRHAAQGDPALSRDSGEVRAAVGPEDRERA